jgi:DNA polymerase III delta prime subunit
MDFLGSESENKERFGRLYTYLQQAPDVVPVFDELEHVLRHAPNLAEHFSAMFGSWLAGGGRTFILICDSNVASTTPLLRGVRPCPLPVLTHAATRQMLLEDRLPKLCDEHGLSVLPSPEALVDSLLNTAPQRYPGRFLPELALHVAESTINRARNRIEFLGQAPLGGAGIEDLWAHIVDEQGLNPEIFGKDPKEFYAKLRVRLTSKVIGQDHAVEQICSVLEMQAQRPPQRAPRGRFLFVGPPGVGKTELARSLAQELGFGDEGFFVFNMSEYSSESARTRFMGADPGYVGFSNTRTIYQCVRERPACVVLLDEIDRADASIQNGKFSREELVQRFADEQLRRLVLEGASDETELAMQRELDQLVGAAKERFARSNADQTERLSAIDRYTELKEMRARLERSIRTSPMDRALMDRIDFIMPFFPIKERPLLERILDLKLAAFGWHDCPESIKTSILDQAIGQKESVRPLERLVKKYLCKEPS